MVSKAQIARAMRPKTKQERGRQKALGECATCTNQAAPWYQCSSCRLTNKIRRVTKRASSVGGVRIEKSADDRRVNLYSIQDAEAIDTLDWRPDPGPDDRRTLPKVGKMPADMLATVINILIEKGSPATEEEICLAWARLKAERSSSLVADISTIIAAQRRRDKKRAS
jgi:hypothetical protein